MPRNDIFDNNDERFIADNRERRDLGLRPLDRDEWNRREEVAQRRHLNLGGDVDVDAPDGWDDEPPEPDWDRDEEPEPEDEPDPNWRVIAANLGGRAMKEVDMKPPEELPVGALSTGRIKLPGFTPKYNFDDEARMRLRNSVIMVKGLPYLVADVLQNKEDVKLQLYDNENYYWIQYGPECDLRPFEPGYITYQNAAWYAVRRPRREAKQGNDERNTAVFLCGVGAENNIHPSQLVEGIRKRKNLQFNATLLEVVPNVLPSLRLSNNIAIFHKNGNKSPAVEYKGRKLGTLSPEGWVDIDDDDMQMSWIHKDLHQVGLSVK